MYTMLMLMALAGVISC
jgi:endoplasmic reticulum chaperone BiP